MGQPGKLQFDQRSLYSINSAYTDVTIDKIVRMKAEKLLMNSQPKLEVIQEDEKKGGKDGEQSQLN